jgi:hypothetical protein
VRLLRFVTVLAALTAIAAPAWAAPQPERIWTILVYMNAKNNLEPFALDNFHDMAQVGGSKDVNLIVELGRPTKHRYTNDDGNWTGVYRFAVKKNGNPVPQESVGHVASPHDDMGKTATLREFVEWGKANYPAQHYMLVIWNHGQGWRFQMATNESLRTLSVRATGNDQGLAQAPATTPAVGGYRAVSADGDTGSILYNSEVQSVVAAEFTAQPLDLLGFDACLMSMLETAYAFAPNAKYMVASEELEPGAGWQYSPWLTQLEATPTAGGDQVAKFVVDAYKQQYGDRYLTTMSALDLTTVRQSAQLLSDFAHQIQQAGANEITALKQARAALQSYGASITPPLRTSVDLLALLSQYEQQTRNATLKAQSTKVRAGLSANVLANYASARSAKPTYGLPYGSEGLAIYFPEDKSAFDADQFHAGYIKGNHDRPVAFVEDTYWPELILAALKNP